jgi:hypothetical protein
VPTRRLRWPRAEGSSGAYTCVERRTRTDHSSHSRAGTGPRRVCGCEAESCADRHRFASARGDTGAVGGARPEAAAPPKLEHPSISHMLRSGPPPSFPHTASRVLCACRRRTEGRSAFAASQPPRLGREAGEAPADRSPRLDSQRFPQPRLSAPLLLASQLAAWPLGHARTRRTGPMAAPHQAAAARESGGAGPKACAFTQQVA